MNKWFYQPASIQRVQRRSTTVYNMHIACATKQFLLNRRLPPYYEHEGFGRIIVALVCECMSRITNQKIDFIINRMHTPIKFFKFLPQRDWRMYLHNNSNGKCKYNIQIHIRRVRVRFGGGITNEDEFDENFSFQKI